MDAFIDLLWIVYVIISLLIIYAIFSIADNTKKTNKLLELLLNEKNPERFSFEKNGRLKDKTTGKTI